VEVVKIVEILSSKYSRLLPDGTYEPRATFTYRTDTGSRGSVDLPLEGLTEEKVRAAIEASALRLEEVTPKPFEVGGAEGAPAEEEEKGEEG